MLLTSLLNFPWWDMDMLAHLPKAWGQLKYLVVVFDYFTKRVEIQALAKIIEENVLISS